MHASFWKLLVKLYTWTAYIWQLTFIFGWNLWSNAQWSLAVELCKCMLNIGHILGKTQTDCFSHLTVSKLLSIRFWNATYTECIVHVVYLCACKENCSLQIYLFSVQVYVLCCKGFFHKRDVHARMTEIPYCWSKSLFTALIWKSWGSKCKQAWSYAFSVLCS